MDKSFYWFLLGGMIAMFLVMWFCSRVYGIALWKIVATALILTPAGYFGAKLMFFIEAGGWDGRSLYGAVFLVPIIMMPTAKLLKIRYGELMDVCTPAGCVMFALLKVKCVIDGCCGGRVIGVRNHEFIFPSQKVECAAFVIILVIVIVMIFKRRHYTQVYPCFMVIYGFARFFLNLFRETTPWIGPLPAGNFWSIISVMTGFAILCLIKQHECNLSKDE